MKYSKDLFHLGYPVSENTVEIFTYDTKKAHDYSFDMGVDEILPASKVVDASEITEVKTIYPSMYRVKYLDFFFRVMTFKISKLRLHAYDEYIVYRYGFKKFGDPRANPYSKWVPREKATPVTEIDDDMGLYLNPWDYRIWYIEDERENEYLLKRKDFIKKEWCVIKNRLKKSRIFKSDWIFKWVPKDQVYVYKEHNEQFLY